MGMFGEGKIVMTESAWPELWEWAEYF